MKVSAMIVFPVFFPILAGLLLLCGKEPKRFKSLVLYMGIGLGITTIGIWNVVIGQDISYTLFNLTAHLPVYFRVDMVGKLFMSLVSLVWIAAGLFSFSYMRKKRERRRFFGFYLMAYGVLAGLGFAGNLITFYLFYEMMTLLTLPLVLHDRTKEAIMAGLKYLLYSLCGAYMVLFGLYVIYRYANTLSFTPKGVLDMAFMMLAGFSVKAGCFPMHGWLPSAHPVAPAPASAVMSGIIVKVGILGVIRTIFYLFGVDFLRGTWVQATVLALSLITVFLGSMLAFLEKGFKKRLAYSTVSQVSYILFGLLLLTPDGLKGAFFQVLFHALVKSCLFLCAGAMMNKTGRHQVKELGGIGKEMPLTLWCYTLCALTLIGIPPTGGFMSKWYLCTGALKSLLTVFSWLGPVTLLVSALLTAGYLLPLTVRGFFPGEEKVAQKTEKKEAGWIMLLPIIVLTAVALLLGIFPERLAGLFSGLAGQLM